MKISTFPRASPASFPPMQIRPLNSFPSPGTQTIWKQCYGVAFSFASLVHFSDKLLESPRNLSPMEPRQILAADGSCPTPFNPITKAPKFTPPPILPMKPHQTRALPGSRPRPTNPITNAIKRPVPPPPKIANGGASNHSPSGKPPESFRPNNARDQEAHPHLQIAQGLTPMPPESSQPGNANAVDERALDALRELVKMKKEGFLDEVEFAAAKKRILNL